MDGVDIKSSTAMIEVYCGPAAAVVHTPAVGRVVVKPGSCVRGIRGPGSWDLYLGKDKRGGAPWQLTLHVSKPTGSAKPGLTMKWKSTQWSAIGGIKLTLGAAGGAVVRGKKASPARQPIRGTFTC
jgi:hypothetical protein